MMKKFFVCLFAICFCAVVFPAIDGNAAETFVYDEADLLTSEEEDALEETAAAFSERWNMDFGVVTTNDAQGKSSRDYADDFYEMHFDTSDERGGVLYLIDMDHREIYLLTCGMAIRYLPDQRIERILDEAYEEVADGDYYGTFSAFFSETENYLEQGILPDQYNYDVETGEIDEYREPRKITSWEIILGLIAGAAAAAGTCGFIAGKYKLKFEDFHYDAYTDSELLLDTKEDRLVNTFVTHRRIPKNDSNGSGGSSGGSISSVHSSSGGTTYGGGGRSF